MVLFCGENFLKRKLFPAPLSKNLKKGGGCFLLYFARSTLEHPMFAPHPSVKVFSQVFFKKLAGLGGAHKNGAFFLPSFFFAPLVPKKMGYCDVLFFIAGETFLKESFSPHPFQRTCTGDFIIYRYFVRSTVGRTMERISWVPSAGRLMVTLLSRL